MNSGESASSPSRSNATEIRALSGTPARSFSCGRLVSLCPYFTFTYTYWSRNTRNRGPKRYSTILHVHDRNANSYRFEAASIGAHPIMQNSTVHGFHKLNLAVRFWSLASLYLWQH